MWKNYLLVALRTLQKQKGYAAINVTGLAAGLACGLFVLLFVQDELRFDRFHADGDRLFRVLQQTTFEEGLVETGSAIPKPLADVLERDYPEVEHVVLTTWPQELLVSDGERTTREEGYHVGPAFFEAFSFPLIAGDARTALDAPDGVVITRALAERRFGPDWERRGVLGQALRIDNRRDFRVTGVAEDPPPHSTFQFAFVLPIQDFIVRNEWVEHWGNNGLRLYARLADGTDAAALGAKIRGLVHANHPDADAAVLLQPFGDQHLYGEFVEGVPGGRIEHVRLFGVVAVLVLLIAGVNFTNLATARAATRAREVGVRKAVGATRWSLARQFLTESVLVALAAVPLAALAVVAGLPAFNALAGKSLTPDALTANLPLLVALGAGVGLVAGVYPALVLSAYGAAGVLRGRVQGPGGAGLRKGLVVFQFAASILLLIGTATVHQQMAYVRSKDLGLDREGIVTMTLEGAARERFDAFREELLRQPGVTAVTAADQSPLNVMSATTDPTWPGKDAESQPSFTILDVGHDFAETMGMELVSGRAFSRVFGADTVNFIVNERAAEAMGMADPVGQRLAFWEREGEVVGVVRDFHMTSLRAPIEPTILRLNTAAADVLFVRTATGRVADALAGLRAVQARFNPGLPLDYAFLDESFEEAYESERRLGALSDAFAGLTAFIACLGLFGLAAFTATRRTKEVGIRKVLGATASSVVALLSRDFLALVLVGFVVAAPLGYLAMERWLEGFAYRVEMSPLVFLGAGGTALFLAALSVSVQALRAASTDPVKALRYE